MYGYVSVLMRPIQVFFSAIKYLFPKKINGKVAKEILFFYYSCEKNAKLELAKSYRINMDEVIA